MEPSRQSGAGETSSASVAELAEIERNARAALTAVEGVIEQAETCRHAVELVLKEVADIGVDVADEHPSTAAINSKTLSQGVRILAVQLAAAGASRDEVADRLRDEFGVEDTDDMLDAIYRRRDALG